MPPILRIRDETGKVIDIPAIVGPPGKDGMSDLGENITEGSTNDTVAFWAEKGSGQAWFSSKGMLVNQPSQYGFVISYTNGADVFQMFSDQTNGVTYFRYGDNVNNWFRNWSQILTANADGIFVTESNIEAHYLQGEWLQTTTTENHRTEPAEKIAVLDGSGWVYHRTPAEILSDIGGLVTVDDIDTIVGCQLMLTFTINGVEYQGERNMLWADWVDSEYNTIGATVSGYNVLIDGNKLYQGTITVNPTGYRVQSGAAYTY